MAGKIEHSSPQVTGTPGGILGHPVILWTGWVLSTTMLAAAGRVGVPALQDLVPGDNLPVDPLVTGLLVGLAQWLILRRLLPVSPGWIAATGLWLPAEFLLFAFRVPGAFLGGLVVGAAQWLVLKNSLPPAGAWVLVSALAWGLAALLSPGLQPFLNLGYTSQYLLFHGLIAAMTGAGLVWLWRAANPKPG